MAEQKCTACDHPRRQHSIIGCTHGDKNYGRCTCTVKYTDKEMFR
jgi:hypothetical protein